MNARSPYFASGIGHALVLAGLLSLSALQRPPALVPGVRIVSLPGGGGGGPKRQEKTVEPQSRPAPPEPRPKPAVKPVAKAPPERPAQRAPDPKGARPAHKQEIVSKTPSKPADVAPTPPVSAAGTGLGSGSATGQAGAGSGGVGLEADGEIGRLSGYLGLLRDKVAANWQPPPAGGRTGAVRAVVYFRIRRAGGEPQNAEIQVSSGIPLFDRMALSAVLSAAPLQPLPSVWREETVDIRFTFYQEY